MKLSFPFLFRLEYNTVGNKAKTSNKMHFFEVTFSHRQSKSKHTKICKKRPDGDNFENFS